MRTGVLWLILGVIIGYFIDDYIHLLINNKDLKQQAKELRKGK